MAAPHGNALSGWYDLFSRGARDWLRHNEKVAESVRRTLPEIVAGADVLSGGARTVRVPVRFLEHYHFQLRAPERREGVGEGEARPGDRIGTPDAGRRPAKGEGGRDQGGFEFMLEFQVDDIVDWLWEEMKLPNLQARVGKAEETDWMREGWDRRGARSRLDRRRSFRESIKRRGSQPDGPAFTDEDLRFRQLTRREQPATQAVVFLVMDVSGSMTDEDRKLAKSFFFWAVQGLRRQYRHLDTVFVAHTTEAWEFDEPQFFEVRGSGGTVASTGFAKVQEIIADRYDASRYNVYLFYASDGDNATSDRPDAERRLGEIAACSSYLGYLEVTASTSRALATETGELFQRLATSGRPTASFAVRKLEEIWDAVRHFFQHQAKAVG
jgi:uncharacterized sporulation protein YeaH/YhbH (DUF444 family)